MTGEKSPKEFDGSFAAHPKQARDAEVALIHQRQVLEDIGVLDFIHTDGVDLTEYAVFQSEGDDMFDGMEDLVPRGAERLGRFFPRESARPTGQKQHVGIVN